MRFFAPCATISAAFARVRHLCG